MRKCRGLPFFQLTVAALTRNSFRAGRSVAFPGSSRLGKKTRFSGAGPRIGTKGPACKTQLVRGGLGLLGGLDADEAAMTALVQKLHVAGDEREKRVVLALAHVFAGLVLGPSLTYEDRARVDELPAKALDAQSLPVRIAAVCRGAAALLMCHDAILFEKNCRARI